jgi:hypothetical protein
LASISLMLFSWWGESKVLAPVDNNPSTTTPAVDDDYSTATDDTTLDVESANIEAQLKNLDESSVEIENSLDDESTI